MEGLARFYAVEGEKIRCELCPHRCLLGLTQSGICQVRKNVEGKLCLPYYGQITAMAIDPIEKKPLYHFRPRSKIFSVGFAGCNLRCPFCQNWEISQTTDRNSSFYSSEALVKAALDTGTGAIAYTYSEPLVHLEYLLETMQLARSKGLANVLVTNGCILQEPAREVLSLCDAANVDLKSFSQRTYQRVLGGDLESVKTFLRLCMEAGLHLEVTTLIVPLLNDSDLETDAMADFIAGLSAQIPWHLSAYHPSYKMSVAATPKETLLHIAGRAKKKLQHIHLGNIV